MDSSFDPSESDGKFRVLIVGDFSGKAWQDTPEREFRPVGVDRDNFDDILASYQIRLDLDGITIPIHEIDDFHPDAIYRLRAFEKALAAGPAAVEAPVGREPAAQRPSAEGGGLLDQILEEHAPAPRPVRAEDANDLAGFIKRATAGHVVAPESPEAKQRVAQRTASAGSLMSAILHDPRFQAVEAAWRAVFMLISELDTDGDLRLFLLDITLPELIASQQEVTEELRRRGKWGVIAANFTFGTTDRDAVVLERLGKLAADLKAPLIAEAEPPGKQTPAAAWFELRKSENARWLGLAVPRFLMRLPYGKATSSVDAFAYEEMPESDHAAYLWANPAFLCAFLIGQGFEANGRGFAKNLPRRVDGLPLHVYREKGELEAKPCAEVLMTEREADRLMDSGYMPLASIKGQDAAMIVRFQSIAMPQAPLPLEGA